MLRSSFLTALASSIVAMLTPAALAAGAATAAAAPHPVAWASRTLNITDTAKLRYSGGSGSVLHETGAASGTLPGSMKANATIGATVTASFTLYTSAGTIKGRGSGTPHGSGTYESFAGTLVATGGTGRYAHAHGHGGFYGTFNRKTYALTIQTTGKLSY